MDTVAAGAQGPDSFHFGRPEGSALTPSAFPYGPAQRAHECGARPPGRDDPCDLRPGRQGPDTRRSASLQPSARPRPISRTCGAPDIAGRTAHSTPLRGRVLRLDPHGRQGASRQLDRPVRVEDASVRVAPRKSRTQRADSPEPHRCAGRAGPDRTSPHGSSPSPRALRGNPRGDTSAGRSGLDTFPHCAAPVSHASGGRAPVARPSGFTSCCSL